MTTRTLILAAAGLATLSLAACNRPAEEAEAGATSMEGAAADGMMTAEGGAVTSGATPGAAGSGSTGATTGAMAGSASRESGATASTGGTVTTTGQVNSDIPADAPSRQTREVQAAAGTETGQVVPYAYSPTNPKHDAKQ